MPTIEELSRDLSKTQDQMSMHLKQMNVLKMLRGQPLLVLFHNLEQHAPEIIQQLRILQKTQSMPIGDALDKIENELLPQQIAELIVHRQKLVQQIIRLREENEYAAASQNQSSEEQGQTKHSATQEKTPSKTMGMEKNDIVTPTSQSIDSEGNDAVTVIDDDPGKDDSGDKNERDADDGDSSGEHEDRASGGDPGSSDDIDGNTEDDAPAAPLSETAEQTESDIHITALDLISSTNSSANSPQGMQTDLETSEKESNISLVGFAAYDTEHPI